MNTDDSTLLQASDPPPPPPLKDVPFFMHIPFFSIAKVIVGILLVGLLSYAIFRYVIPRFKDTSKQVTLVYWGLWEDERVMKGVLSEFEKENPSISVSYVKQDSKQYRERLVTRIQNGTSPDVFRFHNTWLPMLSKILIPFPKDIVENSEFEKQYYPSIVQDLRKNGAIYGIPVGIDTLSLFVNKELLNAAGEKLPVTWDDFLKTAAHLTVKDQAGKIKTSGAAMGTFDNITHSPDIISLLFAQNGVDLKNFSSTSQNASDSLSFYTSFAKQPDNTWDETLDPSILAFAKGNVAMYFGYSWDIFIIKGLNKDLSFQITDAPHLPNREITVTSYWADGVSVKSLHQKEALLLMKFLLKKDTAIKLYTEASKVRLFGFPYAHVALGESLRNNVLVYPFVKQAKTAVSSFFVGETRDEGLNAQMNAYLGNAVRSILGNTSPQSAVETLSSGVSQVLNQYSIK